MAALVMGTGQGSAAPGDTVADRVFGQPDFATATCFVPSASNLCPPIGVALDAAGNLYVADNGRNRVLEYDSPVPAAPPGPPAVGGIVQLRTGADAPAEASASPSGRGYTAPLAAAVAAGALALAAGGWYARRRISA